MTAPLWTITCGDQAENHHGMQIFGKRAETGFTMQDFGLAIPKFKEYNKSCEFYPLDDLVAENSVEDPEAGVLVVRGGVFALLESQGITGKTNKDLVKEMMSFEWDTKYWDTRRQKVLNKRARYNVCFDEKPQKANFEQKKGTVVAWDNVPLNKAIYEALPNFMGDVAKDLKGEGNKYPNAQKYGIGGHGDEERKKVAMWRIGAEAPIGFRGYRNHQKVGAPLFLILEGGDLLFMSEKACGWDWRLTKNDRLTWRHAAGGPKYINQLL